MTLDELLKTSDAPVVLVDQRGSVTFVNDRFSEVFGWARGEIVGKPLTAIIPRDFHDAHHLGFSRFITTEKATLLGQSLKLKAMAKDGRVFDAEHFILGERREGQWVFGATIQPIKAA